MENKQHEVVGPELAGKIHQRSQSTNSVAKVISNIKMTNPIKKLVSQRRKRYTKDGFNLDLTCILCLSRIEYSFLCFKSRCAFLMHLYRYIGQFDRNGISSREVRRSVSKSYRRCCEVFGREA